MNFLEGVYKKVRSSSKQRIILPEGEETRVLRAVSLLRKMDLCFVSIIGRPDKILKISKSEGIDLRDVEIIDSEDYRDLEGYVMLFCEIRKHRGLKEDDARKLILQNPVYYSALSVRAGDFAGFVAGASVTTRDVAKAAIYCIGPKEGTKTISSSSIMILSDSAIGTDGVFIYADAGIIPDPTPEQLADIAVASADMVRLLLNDEPRVAMLSYSTKGSGGTGKSIEKVKEATRLVNEREPDLLIDGEIQLDCAVVPEIAKRKDPESRIKGRANVFIFPNLDAGNIAYKLTERLAKARAIGPLLQGLKKPASDLSRGCELQDIFDAVTITALRAQLGER